MNSIIRLNFTDDQPKISPYCFHTFSLFPYGEFGFLSEPNNQPN